ncbi:hypothetical protein BV25DRAFT_1920686 [Artomyces pyxidatus]|uniref:Uncharacterized protein n=1 Tax=Artomyces pyxidatus TaxID=48021 RepID=A0ACB8SLI8_9AGAM|nr:hypothetical protein BV25DRAFT_1920686 [Artomyces pyxidatus]
MSPSRRPSNVIGTTGRSSEETQLPQSDQFTNFLGWRADSYGSDPPSPADFSLSGPSPPGRARTRISRDASPSPTNLVQVGGSAVTHSDLFSPNEEQVSAVGYPSDLHNEDAQILSNELILDRIDELEESDRDRLLAILKSKTTNGMDVLNPLDPVYVKAHEILLGKAYDTLWTRRDALGANFRPSEVEGDDPLFWVSNYADTIPSYSSVETVAQVANTIEREGGSCNIREAERLDHQVWLGHCVIVAEFWDLREGPNLGRAPTHHIVLKQNDKDDYDRYIDVLGEIATVIRDFVRASFPKPVSPELLKKGNDMCFDIEETPETDIPGPIVIPRNVEGFWGIMERAGYITCYQRIAFWENHPNSPKIINTSDKRKRESSVDVKDSGAEREDWTLCHHRSRTPSVQCSCVDRCGRWSVDC